jgi:hypothetical protein
MIYLHTSALQLPFVRMLKGGHAPLLAVILTIAVFLVVPSAVSASVNPSSLSTISITASRDILETPLTRITVDDVQQLLRQGFRGASVFLNNPDAEVQIVLPEIDPELRNKPSRFAAQRRYHYLAYPDHEYEWRSHRRGSKIVLRLNSPTYEGVSFGLYGLLQERLGFKFYHPKRTLIPSHGRWPLPAVFRWKAIPRFDRKGFHIHTEHPVELTEQMHNPDYPNAPADLKEYIDWLARNQQNVMQFYLLRGIDRERWIRHAGEFVEYAHKRGILIGVELSLSSLQQHAFQTIKLLRFYPSYRKQIDDTLSWLFRVKWDFVSVDFTMGEYLPDLERLLPSLKEYMVKEITERYDTKLFYTTHVIPSTGNGTTEIKARRTAEGASDRCGAVRENTGILIHSVMCYSMTEPHAPVYGNLNLRRMLDKAIDQNRKRETWFWPESAYWVSFDNSVPLLLLMYLDARLSDMKTMEKVGIGNHLTFSSGWEWGYWLVDWSIARWSWSHIEEGKEAVPEPLDMMRDLFPDRKIYRLWHKALALQIHYLKDANLMPFLSALDPSAELPWPFNKPFQPRPPFSYRWLLRSASDAEAEEVLQGPVALLEEYAHKMNIVVAGLKHATKGNPDVSHRHIREEDILLKELTRGIEITALRASHRALTIKALIAKKAKGGHSKLSEHFLAEAVSVRERALSLVGAQETIYRYPVALIARNRGNFTSYHFGYLYPASNLFFWYREEQQVKDERFDGLYMNIWDFGRILSIRGLLW